jgi:hypothetical protein
VDIERLIRIGVTLLSWEEFHLVDEEGSLRDHLDHKLGFRLELLKMRLANDYDVGRDGTWIAPFRYEKPSVFQRRIVPLA